MLSSKLPSTNPPVGDFSSAPACCIPKLSKAALAELVGEGVVFGVGEGVGVGVLVGVGEGVGVFVADGAEVGVGDGVLVGVGVSVRVGVGVDVGVGAVTEILARVQGEDSVLHHVTEVELLEL